MSSVRADRRRRREHAHHQDQLARADTPRRRLTAMCDWLVAEAARGGVGQVVEAIDKVSKLVAEYRANNAPAEVEEGQPS